MLNQVVKLTPHAGDHLKSSWCSLCSIIQ